MSENPKLFEWRDALGRRLPKDCLTTDVTLRDLFAAFALGGLLADPNVGYAENDSDDHADEVIEREVAINAYRFADALLAAREKKDPGA